MAILWTEAAPAISELTDRQRLVYLMIYEWARDKGFQPSIREMSAAFGIISPNGVACHLKGITKKGWIAPCASDHSRSIRILKNPNGSPFQGFAQK